MPKHQRQQRMVLLGIFALEVAAVVLILVLGYAGK